MASAYVFEVVTRCAAPRLRLWLPTDPIPEDLVGPEGNRGIFEAHRGARGEPSGTGTWVGVTGLPDTYDTVALDLARCAGIAAIASPLERAPCRKGGARFGIVLRQAFQGRHTLAVVFGGSGKKSPPRLTACRDFEVLALRVPEPAPVGCPAHACAGELVAQLERVPCAVLTALSAGRADALALGPDSRGIARLGAFKATGPASGQLSFATSETPDDVHQLVLEAHCLEDGRSVTASAPAFLHQCRPRVEIRGPAAARTTPAEAPALFRIGPFDGLEAGQADLVHAAFGDLRRTKRPYQGSPWTFQLRVQPYRRADGAVNDATPRIDRGQLELTEGGDLGVILAVDEHHPHLGYALVEHGQVHARQPLQRTANPFLPADGTFPELAIVLRGAGIESKVTVPDHAILFFLDEHELTNPRDGLLRALDTAQDHCGTPLIMALHVLAPCGCASRLDLEWREERPLRLVGDIRMELARR